MISESLGREQNELYLAGKSDVLVKCGTVGHGCPDPLPLRLRTLYAYTVDRTSLCKTVLREVLVTTPVHGAAQAESSMSLAVPTVPPCNTVQKPDAPATWPETESSKLMSSHPVQQLRTSSFGGASFQRANLTFNVDKHRMNE